jgi:phosphinothricin acetyltransferase
MVRELDIVIESMREDDWEQVRGIYQQGIAAGNATFETQAPTWESWDCSHHRTGRLVARLGGEILGWAALSPVSGRCVYAGVAEVSVYVAAKHHGMGLGKALLKALIEASEENGIWTLQAGVFPENQASLILHERMGFRVVGRRERIGRLNGIWRDVVLLERRSPIVGVG